MNDLSIRLHSDFLTETLQGFAGETDDRSVIMSGQEQHETDGHTIVKCHMTVMHSRKRNMRSHHHQRTTIVSHFHSPFERLSTFYHEKEEEAGQVVTVT